MRYIIPIYAGQSISNTAVKYFARSMPRLTQLNLGNYIWKGVGNDWSFSKQFAEPDLSKVSVYKLSFGCNFLTCYRLFVLV